MNNCKVDSFEIAFGTSTQTWPLETQQKQQQPQKTAIEAKKSKPTTNICWASFIPSRQKCQSALFFHIFFLLPHTINYIDSFKGAFSQFQTRFIWRKQNQTNFYITVEHKWARFILNESELVVERQRQRKCSFFLKHKISMVSETMPTKFIVPAFELPSKLPFSAPYFALHKIIKCMKHNFRLIIECHQINLIDLLNILWASRFVLVWWWNSQMMLVL